MMVWSRLASAKWADAWEERLRGLAGERLAIHYLPAGRSIRLEIYAPTTSEQKLLVDQFGGRLRTLKKDSWLAPGVIPLKPIPIRDRMIVVHDMRELEHQAKLHPDRRVLLVPAGAAFGTGDHATTATCLRLMADESRHLEADSWSCADVGTGTGILAIAAKLLGAGRVEAFDHDRRAIATARDNARVNGTQNIRFSSRMLTNWRPRTAFQLVVANVFSEALIQAAPTLANALCRDGLLIVSGILKHQAQETLAALSATTVFAAPEVHQRGKWTTASLRRIA